MTTGGGVETTTGATKEGGWVVGGWVVGGEVVGGEVAGAVAGTVVVVSIGTVVEGVSATTGGAPGVVHLTESAATCTDEAFDGQLAALEVR
jgi:hypothetical protein